MTSPTLSLTRSALDEMNAADIAAMPAMKKLQLQRDLAEAAQWLKRTQEKFADALMLSYGERCRATLQASGRDFGTAHGSDGEVEFTFDLPKRVKWDQAQLHAIAERIVASGEQAEHYIQAELSVSETKFKSWPPVLQAQFAKARTVMPGKATITLRLSEGGA